MKKPHRVLRVTGEINQITLRGWIIEPSTGREVAIKIALYSSSVTTSDAGMRRRAESSRLRVARVKGRIPNERAEGYTNAPWRRRAPAGTVASCRYLSVGLRRACYVVLCASNGRRAAARASERAKIAPEQPVVASPRLVSSRLVRAKRGSEDAVAAGPMMLPRPATGFRCRRGRGTR